MGTSTITVSVGSVSGSTALTVLALVSMQLSPEDPVVSVGAGQQFTATATLSDNSTRDVTTRVIWNSSNPSIVLIGSVPGFDGFAMGAGIGTATITATSGSISANTSVTVQNPVMPSAPVISSISPSVGASGTQVTISGSGFGVTQGEGGVWLGSTYGAVVSWSDTQIVATVAPIARSGTAQVKQNGLSSNAVPFNVSTATISNISPNSGVPGTQVTIIGSGFGADQGNGQVWLGTTNGVVQSWSDTQVVAVVASGSTSGKAQVLQNGIWSNSVPFALNSLHIDSVNPTSGAPGTAVTITGSGFGAGQSGGTVWLGSTNGQVTNWSDTQVVAVVDPSALTGVVRIQQNGEWSNAVAFTVPTGGDALTVVPNVLNLFVGETHAIQALNSSSQPVTGLTWTSSDTNVISLSTDDPPNLTALAAGHATITAGTASADVTVYSADPPAGTVIWSNPGNGSGVVGIVPAVPSATGVADVFAFQTDGTVQAIKSDGTTAWTASLNGASPSSQTLADFQGGLVVPITTTGLPWTNSLVTLDGLTGQVKSAYTVVPHESNELAGPMVHPDGTIFTVHFHLDPSTNFWSSAILGIDRETGSQRFSIALDQSTTYCLGGSAYNYCSGHTAFETSPMVDTPVIAGDGYYYITYSYTENIYGGSESYHGIEHLMLLRVGTDGSSFKTTIREQAVTTICQGDSPTICVQDGAPIGGLHATLLTNADTGVLVSWVAYHPAYCPTLVNWGDCVSPMEPEAAEFGVAPFSGGNNITSFPVRIPGQATPLLPVLQAQNGTFIGSVGLGPSPFNATQYNMVAFNQDGSVLWSVPGDYPAFGTNDGGVIGYSGITYDGQGRALNQGALPGAPSWHGFLYSGAETPLAAQASRASVIGRSAAAQATGGVTSRIAPPLAMLQADLLKAAGANVSGTGTTLNLPDDPWSLRLVPTYDTGSEGNRFREIIYTLTRLDGTTRPKGNWYVTEHHSNFDVTPSDPPDGMSGGTAPDSLKQFDDNVSCPCIGGSLAGCGDSHQTFTVSLTEGKCGQPSYGQRQKTPCESNGSGEIVVHTQKGDYGTLWTHTSCTSALVNDRYRWPGID